MSLRNQIQIEPVRTLSALAVFGQAVIMGLSFHFGYTGDAVALLTGGWQAFIAFLGTFVRNQVTANPVVNDKVHDTIVALSPFAPVITEAIVPVASSPLLDSSVVVTDNSVPLHPSV